MKERRISKIEKRELAKRDNRIGCTFTIISLLAVVPLGYSIWEYHVTFIPFNYLVTGSLIAGLIMRLILNLTIPRFFEWKDFTIISILISIIIGCYISSIFFLSNIYLSKSELYSVETPIIEKFEKGRYHKVFVTVNINGFEKDIPIHEKEISEMDNYNSIVLTFDRGFWNFPFVVNKVLKK